MAMSAVAAGVGEKVAINSIVWLGRTIYNWWCGKIEATQIELPNQAGRIAIAHNAVRLPGGTEKFTLHGTYSIKPTTGNYAVIIRRGDRIWFSKLVPFAGNGTWHVDLHFSKEHGDRQVVLVKMSSDVRVLFDYYGEVAETLEPVDAELKAKKLNRYIGCTISHEIKGMDVLQLVQVSVGG